jgi:type VI secretion system FHA domain protein
MNLTLEITGPQAAGLGPTARKTFSEAGGTIGRLRDNQWVLTDAWVSSHHAVIRFVAGVFYIEDTSTNGVFLNSHDNRLPPGQPHPLRSGDRILIDPYEIQALVTGGVEQTADPFADIVPAARRAPEPMSPAPYAPMLPPDVVGGGEDDNWLDQLGPGPQRPASTGPTAAGLGNSPLLDHYQPPASIPPATPVAPPSSPAPSAPPASSQSVIPADWFADTSPPGLPRPPRVQPPPPPEAQPVTPPDRAPAGQPDFADLAPPPITARESRRGRPPRVVEASAPVEPRRPAAAPAAGRDTAGLQAVLEGAGIEGVAVTPELAASFGQILRVVVSGVMDILQARQKIKNEFRMEMTSFKPAQNNPLKFSANVDDALHNLLVKRNSAYLGPVEAFEDAFDDLRNHQMAMLAGVRVAFDAMLASFDPDTLQERFDRDVKKGALINMPGKLRYWDQYCETIRGMVRDSETSFRELFGEEFATAYEQQLARLKAEIRARKR